MEFKTREYSVKDHGVLKPDQLYILVSKYDKKNKSRIRNFYRLDQIFYSINDNEKDKKKVSSYDQFMELRQNSKVRFHFPKEDGTLDVSDSAETLEHGSVSLLAKDGTDVDPIKVYPADIIDSVNEYESTTLQPKGKVTVMSGYKRTVSFAEKEWSNKDAYVLVKVSRYNDRQFFKKSELYAIVGGQKKSYLDLTENEIQNLVLYTPNDDAVEILYNDAEYDIGKLLSYNKLDLSTMTEKTYTLLSVSQQEAKDTATDAEIAAIKTKEEFVETSSSQISRYFSIQTPVVVTEPDPENPGETKSVYKIKAQNFEVVQNGDRLLVKPKYLNAETILEKKDLFLDEACTKSIENLSPEAIAGRPLFAKHVNNEEETIIIEIDPITIRQAELTYAPIKSYQPVEGNEQALEDNAYLKLSNGSYVKESVAIKPLGFKILEDQTTSSFSYYVVIGSDGKSYIVEKDIFAGKAAVEQDIGGVTVQLSRNKAYKVNQTYNLNEADIIQTKLNYKNEVNSCDLMGSFGSDGKFVRAQEQDRDVLFGNAYEKFKANYKNGEYSVYQVFVDNKLVNIDEEHSRYLLTEDVYLRDYGHDYYETLKTKPLELKEKDGQVDLVGGPKFSAAKANKKFLGKVGKYTAIATMACSTGSIPGLVVLALGVLPLAITTLVIGTPIAAIVNGIRSRVKNGKKHKWQDKTEINQPKWEKEIEESLANEYANLLTLAREGKISEEVVRANFQQIKAKIAMLGASRFESQFKFVDGKAVIDENNSAHAHNMSAELRDRLARSNELDKLIKEAEEKLAKTGFFSKKRFGRDDLQAKIAAWTQEKNDLAMEIENIKNANAQGQTFEMSPQCEEMQRRAERAQSLLLAKYCGVRPDFVSVEEFEMIQKIEYDVKEDKYYVVQETTTKDIQKRKLKRTEIDLEKGTGAYAKLVKKIQSSEAAKVGESGGVEQPKTEEELKKELAENERYLTALRTRMQHILENLPFLAQLEDVSAETVERMKKEISEKREELKKFESKVGKFRDGFVFEYEGVSLAKQAGIERRVDELLAATDSLKSFKKGVGKGKRSIGFKSSDTFESVVEILESMGEVEKILLAKKGSLEEQYKKFEPTPLTQEEEVEIQKKERERKQKEKEQEKEAEKARVEQLRKKVLIDTAKYFGVDVIDEQTGLLSNPDGECYLTEANVKALINASKELKIIVEGAKSNKISKRNHSRAKAIMYFYNKNKKLLTQGKKEFEHLKDEIVEAIKIFKENNSTFKADNEMSV